MTDPASLQRCLDTARADHIVFISPSLLETAPAAAINHFIDAASARPRGEIKHILALTGGDISPSFQPPEVESASELFSGYSHALHRLTVSPRHSVCIPFPASLRSTPIAWSHPSHAERLPASHPHGACNSD